MENRKNIWKITLRLFVSGLLLFAIGCSDDDTDPVNPPTLTTLDVTDITETSAKSGGNITDDRGATVTERGVIWSTAADLSVNNYEGITIEGAGAGSFTSNITDLEPETQYYVKAYATNMNGTGYGNSLAFTTLEKTTGTVMDVDGNEYVTIIIGDQEWMAENLLVSKYNNGDAIPTSLNNADWGETTEGASVIYPHGSIDGLNSDQDVLEAYGVLYNWYAVNDTRGLCPVGWSVPSDDDWTQLVNYAASQGFTNVSDNPNGTGNALRSCRQVGHPDGGDCSTSEHPRWDSDDTHHGFDAFGFSALPGGYRRNNGTFYRVGNFGHWWSATEFNDTSAWFRDVYSRYGSAGRGHFSKITGLSVRCLRDAD